MRFYLSFPSISDALIIKVTHAANNDDVLMKFVWEEKIKYLVHCWLFCRLLINDIL